MVNDYFHLGGPWMPSGTAQLQHPEKYPRTNEIHVNVSDSLDNGLCRANACWHAVLLIT